MAKELCSTFMKTNSNASSTTLNTSKTKKETDWILLAKDVKSFQTSLKKVNQVQDGGMMALTSGAAVVVAMAAVVAIEAVAVAALVVASAVMIASEAMTAIAEVVAAAAASEVVAEAEATMTNRKVLAAATAAGAAIRPGEHLELEGTTTKEAPKAIVAASALEAATRLRLTDAQARTRLHSPTPTKMILPALAVATTATAEVVVAQPHLSTPPASRPLVQKKSPPSTSPTWTQARLTGNFSTLSSKEQKEHIEPNSSWTKKAPPRVLRSSSSTLQLKLKVQSKPAKTLKLATKDCSFRWPEATERRLELTVP